MRILIVEDEPNIAAYIKRGLQEHGYAIDVATTGQEALDWIAVAPYDQMVLDIMLPEMNGLEVCRELRNQGHHMPVLMLTARDSVDDRVAGLDAGADDYLVKPFALKELLARLRALARRMAADGSMRINTLEVADLKLDTLTCRVQRGGKTIALAAKEYAILEFLMREQGRIVSRTMIAEHVWSYDVFNQSNVVDVYIRNLRRKLDDPFSVKLIHTIRGMGYRLATEDEAA